jgi:uncharacterized protein with GYD domain
MATYLVLGNYTQQGITNVKQSPARLDAARGVFKKLGVEIISFYLAMGRYDLILLVQAPDDSAMAKAILAVSSQGNVHTETLRVFNEVEFRKVISELP